MRSTWGIGRSDGMWWQWPPIHKLLLSSVSIYSSMSVSIFVIIRHINVIHRIDIRDTNVPAMPLPVAVWRKVEWTKVWSRLIFVVDVILLIQPEENWNQRSIRSAHKRMVPRYIWLVISLPYPVNLECIGDMDKPVPDQAVEPGQIFVCFTSSTDICQSTLLASVGTKESGSTVHSSHPSARVPSSRQTAYVWLRELVQTKGKDWPKTIIKPLNQGPL